MEASANSDRKTPPASKRVRRGDAAFSLVEIALALGIMAFALVSVFGLMPLGLSTFRKASDISVGWQIAQLIIGEAQQTDYDTLLGSSHVNQTTPFSKEPFRYFDNQGGEQAGKQSATTIYWVNTRIVPSTPVPAGANGTDGITNVNKDVATITVQVASNPGGAGLTLDAATGLWKPRAGISILTHSTFVARTAPSVPSAN